MKAPILHRRFPHKPALSRTALLLPRSPVPQRLLQPLSVLFVLALAALQELYIQPDKLIADDCAVLAEAAKWSRANADVLADTHGIRGDPGKWEVYGYASWTPRKGIVMLRNPDNQPHEFVFEVGAAFELPPGAAPAFALTTPWADDAGKPSRRRRQAQPRRRRLACRGGPVC
jgi:hypothetical protein